MTTLITEATWERRPDVLWRTVNGGLLLLPAGATEPVLLDGVAPVLWELLAEPVSFAEAVAVLAEVFAVEHDVVERDLSDFLRMLHGMGAAACR